MFLCDKKKMNYTQRVKLVFGITIKELVSISKKSYQLQNDTSHRF